MQHEGTLRLIETKYRSLAPMMDERVRRHWVAAEAQAYGWGGVSAVSSAQAGQSGPEMGLDGTCSLFEVRR